MRDGICDVIPQKTLSGLTADDLQLLLSGRGATLTMDEWRGECDQPSAISHLAMRTSHTATCTTYLISITLRILFLAARCALLATCYVCID